MFSLIFCRMKQAKLPDSVMSAVKEQHHKTNASRYLLNSYCNWNFINLWPPLFFLYSRWLFSGIEIKKIEQLPNKFWILEPEWFSSRCSIRECSMNWMDAFPQEKRCGWFVGMLTCNSKANVYHATSDAGERAVKVYKTSILVFKDRWGNSLIEQPTTMKRQVCHWWVPFQKRICKTQPQKDGETYQFSSLQQH